MQNTPKTLGEFPTTLPYAAGSADRLRAPRVRANAKRNDASAQCKVHER